MSSALEKQVYIYSIGTESFYTDKEHEIHNKMVKLYILRSKIDKAIKNKKDNRLIRRERLIKTKKNINKIVHNYKSELTSHLKEFKGLRDLRNDSLTDNKVIGMFDSALTRTIGMKVNNLSTDLFIIRSFYFNVLKNIMEDGFTYKGEKYIYFSSSAGQIRTKKVVFIKEALWTEYEGSLTCGLSIEEINSKGGCNVNKLLAYKALTASASNKWNGFDIDRTIVVPDLETEVNSIFDYINRDTYEIDRKEMKVPIEHTDGCGMILPRKSKKAFMTRLPYVKGLLVPYPFDKFAQLNGNTKVKDIYGKEWDIIEDDIQVIFTKSQFKMKAYYNDWEDYKTRFKDNNCQAVKLNEEDIGENATLNYQMLQTLTDMSDKELKILSQPTIDDILKVGNDKETMLRILGATATNKNKNQFQLALTIYPELLNDEHSKKVIKDKKKSMVNNARAGKLRINGRYLYLIPDLYAFCERLFLGIKNPKGLLNNGNVYCKVYDKGKVDILRSPHLYKEHCVRENVEDDEMDKWFVTNGIYTSIHDPISKILQFDNDGDKALVIQDDLFITVAERNMEDVYPLYYEMSVAEPEVIDNEKIYDSLLLAFKANIGEVSNNITKIFNSENEVDIKVVKWLTAENNYIIDYAKTLYMPNRPVKIEKRIKESIKGKVPYFFIEAKNKDKDNVSPITKSTVNRLRKVIPNRNIKFEAVAGNFDYKVLMSEEIEYVNRNIIATYRRLNRNKEFMIRNTNIKDKTEGMLYVYKHIRDELSKIESNANKIVNVLVKELFDNTKSPNKTTLWNCYGDILVSNIRQNLKRTKQCECCGIRIEMTNGNIKYCKECQSEVQQKQKNNWKREKWKKS